MSGRNVLGYRNYLVFGAARSGLAAARLLKSRGKNVVVFDQAAPEKLADARRQLEELQIPFLSGCRPEAGGYREETSIPAPDSGLQAPGSETQPTAYSLKSQAYSLQPTAYSLPTWEVLVLSPGIPPSHPLVHKAEEEGCLVCSEIEIGSAASPAPILAITGTNGKTTVTHLTAHLFQCAGFNAPVAGNVGTPLCSVVTDPALKEAGAVISCEVSSYQLETIVRFRPAVACVLNITPDHLDRYGSVERYAEAKLRITLNQAADDVLVLNADDPRCLSFASRTQAEVWLFSLERPVATGTFVRLGTVVLSLGDPDSAIPVIPLRDIPLPGMHNAANVLAAVAIGAARGLDPAVMAAAVRKFRAVPHRIEWVGQVAGVDYYNDSKATNLDSLEKALLSFERPIVLIAGGRDKGAPWTVLNDLVKSRVKGLVLIGEAAPIGKAAWGDLVARTEMAQDMADAVRRCRAMAGPGDVVLLSPACASFDMYRNFEERGDHFRRLVQEMV
jgi:UDP-N-acetylmuramoylalanine--D-glutamate ligase